MPNTGEVARMIYSLLESGEGATCNELEEVLEKFYDTLLVNVNKYASRDKNLDSKLDQLELPVLKGGKAAVLPPRWLPFLIELSQLLDLHQQQCADLLFHFVRLQQLHARDQGRTMDVLGLIKINEIVDVYLNERHYLMDTLCALLRAARLKTHPFHIPALNIITRLISDGLVNKLLDHFSVLCASRVPEDLEPTADHSIASRLADTLILEFTLILQFFMMLSDVDSQNVSQNASIKLIEETWRLNLGRNIPLFLLASRYSFQFLSDNFILLVIKLLFHDIPTHDIAKRIREIAIGHQPADGFHAMLCCCWSVFASVSQEYESSELLFSYLQISLHLGVLQHFGSLFKRASQNINAPLFSSFGKSFIFSFIDVWYLKIAHDASLVAILDALFCDIFNEQPLLVAWFWRQFQQPSFDNLLVISAFNEFPYSNRLLILLSSLTATIKTEEDSWRANHWVISILAQLSSYTQIIASQVSDCVKYHNNDSITVLHPFSTPDGLRLSKGTVGQLKHTRIAKWEIKWNAWPLLIGKISESANNIALCDSSQIEISWKETLIIYDLLGKLFRDDKDSYAVFSRFLVRHQKLSHSVIEITLILLDFACLRSHGPPRAFIDDCLSILVAAAHHSPSFFVDELSRLSSINITIIASRCCMLDISLRSFSITRSIIDLFCTLLLHNVHKPIPFLQFIIVDVLLDSPNWCFDQQIQKWQVFSPIFSFFENIIALPLPDFNGNAESLGITDYIFELLINDSSIHASILGAFSGGVSLIQSIQSMEHTTSRHIVFEVMLSSLRILRNLLQLHLLYFDEYFSSFEDRKELHTPSLISSFSGRGSFNSPLSSLITILNCVPEHDLSTLSLQCLFLLSSFPSYILNSVALPAHIRSSPLPRALYSSIFPASQHLFSSLVEPALGTMLSLCRNLPVLTPWLLGIEDEQLSENSLMNLLCTLFQSSKSLFTDHPAILSSIISLFSLLWITSDDNTCKARDRLLSVCPDFFPTLCSFIDIVANDKRDLSIHSSSIDSSFVDPPFEVPGFCHRMLICASSLHLISLVLFLLIRSRFDIKIVERSKSLKNWIQDTNSFSNLMILPQEFCSVLSKSIPSSNRFQFTWREYGPSFLYNHEAIGSHFSDEACLTAKYDNLVASLYDARGKLSLELLLFLQTSFLYNASLFSLKTSSNLIEKLISLIKVPDSQVVSNRNLTLQRSLVYSLLTILKSIDFQETVQFEPSLSKAVVGYFSLINIPDQPDVLIQILKDLIVSILACIHCIPHSSHTLFDRDLFSLITKLIPDELFGSICTKIVPLLLKSISSLDFSFLPDSSLLYLLSVWVTSTDPSKTLRITGFFVEFASSGTLGTSKLFSRHIISHLCNHPKFRGAGPTLYDSSFKRNQWHLVWCGVLTLLLHLCANLPNDHSFLVQIFEFFTVYKSRIQDALLQNFEIGLTLSNLSKHKCNKLGGSTTTLTLAATEETEKTIALLHQLSCVCSPWSFGGSVEHRDWVLSLVKLYIDLLVHKPERLLITIPITSHEKNEAGIDESKFDATSRRSILFFDQKIESSINIILQHALSYMRHIMPSIYSPIPQDVQPLFSPSSLILLAQCQWHWLSTSKHANPSPHIDTLIELSFYVFLQHVHLFAYRGISDQSKQSYHTNLRNVLERMEIHIEQHPRPFLCHLVEQLRSFTNL